MSRAVHGLWLAVVLGVVLGGAGLATAQVGAPTGPPTVDSAAGLTPVGPAAGNTSERLPVATENATEAYTNASLDPAMTTSIRFEQTRAEFESYRVQEAVRVAAGPDEQLALTTAEIETLRAELDEVYAAERRAYRAFAAGDIDGSEFMVRIARVHNRAEALDRRAHGIRIALGSIEATDRTPEINVRRGRLRRVQTDARAFHGPAGDRIVAGIAGERSGAGQLWVAGTPHGYEVATLRGSDYVREAYLATNRDRSGDVVFRNIGQGLTRAVDLYPWTFENAVEAEHDASGSLFWSHVDHPHGETVMYLDAATNSSFREAHQLNVPTLAYEEVAAKTSDNVTVTVSWAFTGGPAQVHVIDEERRNALGGVPVSINGTTVGQTAPDGTLRTIAPAGDATITVRTAGMTIEVAVPAR